MKRSISICDRCGAEEEVSTDAQPQTYWANRIACVPLSVAEDGINQQKFTRDLCRACRSHLLTLLRSFFHKRTTPEREGERSDG